MINSPILLFSCRLGFLVNVFAEENYYSYLLCGARDRYCLHCGRGVGLKSATIQTYYKI